MTFILAVGVGWAETTWVETAAGSLTTGDVVVIVDKTSLMAMPNNNGTSSSPTATAVTLSSGKTEITSDVAEKLQWVVEVNNGTYKFGVSGTQNYLYCTNSNSGVRVGTNSNNAFTIFNNSGVPFLLNTATSRYIGVYNNQDWRCYTSINNNISASVVAFYKKTESVSDIATPVISGTTPFYGSTQVSISCETNGASIYYTTDGTDPTTSSTLYSTPFTITETTTVKAIAALNGETSNVAFRTFTANLTVSSIAEFNELSENDNFKYTGDNLVYIISNSGGNNHYVQDGSKGMLIYGTLGQTYQLGDEIPGGFTGTRAEFNGAPEMKNPDGFTASTNNVDLTPVELTPNEVNLANFGRYAIIKNAGFDTSAKTITAGGQTIAYHTTFNSNIPTDGAAYDVIGVCGYYKPNNGEAYPQFLPISFEPAETSGPTYYLAGSFNMNGSAWIEQDPDYKFTKLAAGGYKLAGKPMINGTTFKIIKVEGGTETWLGGNTDDDNYGVHKDWCTDIELSSTGKDFKIIGRGDLTFTINSDEKLSITGWDTNWTSDAYIAGSFNNWSGEKMAYSNGIYTITKEVADNAEFKIVDDYNKWYGGGVAVTTQNQGQELSMSTSGGNFSIVNAGKYLFTVNSSFTNVIVKGYYGITVNNNDENGSVAADKAEALVGESVTLTITPEEGYELDELTVMAGEAVVAVENNQFTMPAGNVTVSATFKVALPESKVYRLVTSASDFVSGKKYLIANLDGTALIGDLIGDSGKQYASRVTDNFIYDSENKIITLKDGCETTVITLGGSTDAWTFNNGSGYLAYTSSTTTSNNYLWLVTDASSNGATWKIDLSETAKIVHNNYNTSRYLQYNSNNGQERFSGYTGTQKGIAFYRQVEAGEVFTPVISGETPFLNSTEITITCSTEGASIYYTLNGDEPTNQSTLYSEPFTLTETTTVKAIAYNEDNESSEIATMTFEMVPRVATIADYIALETYNKMFMFTGNAVVTYQNGENTWIKDNTGYALFYSSDVPEYENGDVIPSGWTGEKSLYNNSTIEIINPLRLNVASETADASPEIKAVEDVKTDAEHAYYQLNGVSLSIDGKNITISDDNSTCAGYNKFNIELPESVEGNLYNVIGIVAIYQGNAQLNVISIEKVNMPVELDGVTFTTDRHWASWYGDANYALPEGGDVTAYIVTGVDGDEAVVQSVNYIPANTAVLLNCETAKESVSVIECEAGEQIAVNKLEGTLEPKAVNNAYVLYNNQFILAQNGTTIGAHRCYLPIDNVTGTSTGAPSKLRISTGAVVTGIEDVLPANTGDVMYYDLTGRCIGKSLNGMRGIFITSDGKKVVK